MSRHLGFSRFLGFTRLLGVIGIAVVGSGFISHAHSQEKTASALKKAPYVRFKSVYVNRNKDFANSILTEGELGGKGKMTLDQNTCTITLFGDKGICTNIHFSPIDITLKQLNLKDPTGNGRRIFQIQGDIQPKNAKFYFVVPKRKSEPHRLIVDHGNDKRSVFTLEPDNKTAKKSDDKKP